MPKIEFDGKLNLLALTSFVLSLIALSSQLVGYVRGARVELHAPQTVVLRTITYPSTPGQLFLIFEAPLTYTNVGAVGYSAIMGKEQLLVTIDGKPRNHVAFMHFVDVDDRKTSPTVEPEYRGSESAGPKVVPAQGAITHGVVFNPKHKICAASDPTPCDPAENSVLLTDQVLNALKSTERIDIVFSTTVHGQRDQKTARCWFNGNYLDIPTLKSRAYFAFDCNAAG